MFNVCIKMMNKNGMSQIEKKRKGFEEFLTKQDFSI